MKSKFLITALLGVLIGMFCSCGKDDVSVNGISINESNLTLKKGETTALVATITPEDATNKNVIWSSSDESIATVSQNGDVVTKKIGKVIINAKSSDKNNIQENCEITISSSDNIQYNPYGDKQQW